MKPSYTPEEHSTICPYLIVDDLKAQVDFLKSVFSALGQYHYGTGGPGLWSAGRRFYRSTAEPMVDCPNNS